MDKKIFSNFSIEIHERDEIFFIRYDAGAHQVVMREDEITQEEAEMSMKSKEDVVKVLVALQKRLIEAGIDPYRSNTQ